MILEGFQAPLAVAVGSTILSLLVTPLVRRFAISRGAIDDPTRDDRRVHTKAFPRWGGIAVYVSILVTLLVALPIAYPLRPFPVYLIALLVIGGLITSIGALDDIKSFSARWQMLWLLVAGVAVQFFYDGAGRVQIQGMGGLFGQTESGWISFGMLAIPITAIYIFVVTKTMDTIDGIDGLASGIAIIGGSTLAIVGVLGEQPRVALVAAAIVGACIGFLRYNYNPASIILGTGGAQLIGFLLAGLSIVGAMKTAAALVVFVPLFVFGVPLFDAGFVVIRRLLHRQPVTQADKRHIHHTLLKKGLTQRQTVWVLYLAAAALCGLLLVMVGQYG